MQPGPRRLESLLYTLNAELGTILRHADYLQRIREAMADVLPATAAAHIHVAAVDDRHLLVHTDSTGWATRLRYAEPAIRRALAQRLRLYVETVRIRVRPALTPPAAQPVERRISGANRDYIRRIAGYIDDEDLARALHALADCPAA